MTDKTTPREEGRKAFEEGKPLRANPYRRPWRFWMNDKEIEWWRGYLHAKHPEVPEKQNA